MTTSPKTSPSIETQIASKKTNVKSYNKKPLSPLLITTSLSSIAALILGFYSINQILVVKDNLSYLEIKSQNNQTKIANTLEEKLIFQQQDLTKKLQQQQSDHNLKITDLNQLLLDLNTQKNGDDYAWRLKKVAYLLNMAQLTLHWEKTPGPAIALLSSADALLKNMNNPRLTLIRQSISHEITQLETLPKVDMTGLLSKINAVSMQINNLPLKTTPFEKSVPSHKDPTEKTALWTKTLNKSIETLSKIIVIRKHQKNYQPLISDKEKQLITREIKLGLKQSEWALISQNQALYQLSLTQIQKTIEVNFDESSNKTQSILKILADLKEVIISYKMPEINQSYQQLLDLVKKKKTGDNA